MPRERNITVKCREYLQENDPALTVKKCKSCNISKPLMEYYWDEGKPDCHRYECKQCTNRRYDEIDPDGFKRKLYTNKRADALSNGVQFKIAFEEITFPTHCPILKTELSYEKGNSKKGLQHIPSFDRVDSSKGYIRGNVMVISAMANSIKSNLTITQIETLLEYMKHAEINSDTRRQKVSKSSITSSPLANRALLHSKSRRPTSKN